MSSCDLELHASAVPVHVLQCHLVAEKGLRVAEAGDLAAVEVVNQDALNCGSELAVADCVFGTIGSMTAAAVGPVPHTVVHVTTALDVAETIIRNRENKSDGHPGVQDVGELLGCHVVLGQSNAVADVDQGLLSEDLGGVKPVLLLALDAGCVLVVVCVHLGLSVSEVVSG